MAKFKPSNARELTSGATPERLQRAQELINQYQSLYRVAAEIEVPYSAINAWCRAKLLRQPKRPANTGSGFRLSSMQKLAEVKKLNRKGKSAEEIAASVGLADTTINRWKRQGIIK